MGFGEEDPEVKYHFISFHIILRVCDLSLLMFTLVTWLRLFLSDFPDLQVLAFLAKSHYAQSHRRNGNCAPSPGWCSIYINYLKCFCADLSIPPHLLIYSIIYLCQYGLLNVFFIL